MQDARDQGQHRGALERCCPKAAAAADAPTSLDRSHRRGARRPRRFCRVSQWDWPRCGAQAEAAEAEAAEAEAIAQLVAGRQVYILYFILYTLYSTRGRPAMIANSPLRDYRRPATTASRIVTEIVRRSLYCTARHGTTLHCACTYTAYTCTAYSLCSTLRLYVFCPHTPSPG